MRSAETTHANAGSAVESEAISLALSHAANEAVLLETRRSSSSVALRAAVQSMRVRNRADKSAVRECGRRRAWQGSGPKRTIGGMCTLRSCQTSLKKKAAIGAQDCSYYRDCAAVQLRRRREGQHRTDTRLRRPIDRVDSGCSQRRRYHGCGLRGPPKWVQMELRVIDAGVWGRRLHKGRCTPSQRRGL